MYEREAEKHTEETAGNSLDDMEKVLFLWYMHISSWNHFFMFHVCWFTSFTLTKWLSVLSQDIGRYCATVYTPTPDLSTHQEDVHRSCENDLRHRVWTQGHWGTLETVSTFTAVDSNNKSVTGRGHLKAKPTQKRLHLLVLFHGETKGRYTSREPLSQANKMKLPLHSSWLCSLFQTPVWATGRPRERAWHEWHHSRPWHEENGDGSAFSSN